MALTPAEQRLSASIAARKGDLLADLKRHVALPTGAGNTPVLDLTRTLLTDRLRKLGASVELVPGVPKADWLYGSDPRGQVPPTAICRRTRPNSPSVLLCGHLDTVHDPKSAFRELSISDEGKTATGPGCVDMKGGLVIALAALEALEAEGHKPSWGFILVSDEETGSYHSSAAMEAEARGAYKAGLVLEPAMPDGGLVIERPGSGQFMIECRGKAAHVGRDFTAGVSAVNALANCIQQVAAMPDPAKGIIANIGPLEGGIAANVVPDRARAWGNVRFPTPDIGETLGGKLEALQTVPTALPAVSVSRSFNRPAKPLTATTEQLALKARAAAEDLGQKLPFGKTGGVCDGNNLQAAGLPTIDTLGVRGGGLHTPQEWIELASLVERCQLLAILILRLCEGR
jgi:glutamate carboxypeptidase